MCMHVSYMAYAPIDAFLGQDHALTMSSWMATSSFAYIHKDKRIEKGYVYIYMYISTYVYLGVLYVNI